MFKHNGVCKFVLVLKFLIPSFKFPKHIYHVIRGIGSRKHILMLYPWKLSDSYTMPLFSKMFLFNMFTVHLINGMLQNHTSIDWHIHDNFLQDPAANGVLAIQTIRNNIMASTLLATAAITLSSLIGVYVSSTSNTANTASKLVYGNKTQIVSSIKYFAVSLCYLVAFLCNVEAIRYYSHVSFMTTMPTLKGKSEPMEYIARNLNRGSYFWSFGLRAFYLSFPLFLWIFGPIPMFSCCFIMLFVLYFLDTTTSFTRNLHKSCMMDETKGKDIGSVW